MHFIAKCAHPLFNANRENFFSKIQNISNKITKLRQKNLTIYLCSLVDANLVVTTAQFIHEIMTTYNLLTLTLKVPMKRNFFSRRIMGKCVNMNA